MTRLVFLRRASVSLVTCIVASVVLNPAATAFATPPTPAHWSLAGMPSKPLLPGTKFTLTLTARIQPGWHIYAMEEPEGGPIATQIGLAEGDPLTLLSVDEPRPQKVRDPVLHQSTGMFQTAVSFTLHLQAPPKPLKPGTASTILVRYQSCNDQICLPPRTDMIPLPLAGV